MYKPENVYLEDEIRDGFYVPSIAKRAFTAELSILHEINRICEKYNIRYYADWGTMLGTVRHRGFIPWDDDLDIFMFRSDLNRFIEVSEKELPEGFKVQSFLNNDYSWKFIVNIVNTDRMCFTPEYLKGHYNFPYMATIDIFVLDSVYDDDKAEEERREKVKYILSIADALTEDNCHSNDMEILLNEVEKRSGKVVDKKQSFIEIKRQLYVITQNIICELDNDASEFVTQQIPLGVYHKLKYRRDLFNGIVKLPFEDTYVCVPALYDRIIRNKYGNYWEIRIGAAGHGYPYYKAQREALGLREDEDYLPYFKYKGLPDLSLRNDTVEAIEDFKKAPEYNGEFERETVVFLPFNGLYWESMKPLYEEEIKKENVDVFVVPLPYYYKEYNGTFVGEPQYDLEKYPEELPVYLLEQLDLKAMFPDRIYIQNPYDEYNMCMSIPKEYYASNIVNFTKKLIYVPWFKTKDFEKNNYPQWYNMRYYCTMPGVVYADEVILHSDMLKDVYVDKLSEFAGEETRKIWDSKIIVRDMNAGGDSFQSESGKKTLVYYTCPSTILEYEEAYIEKIKKCLDIFSANSDNINVVWHIDKCDMEILKNNNPGIHEKIVKVQESISIEEYITVDNAMTGDELARIGSAYYGDPSYIAKDFFMYNKPVMIGNTEIIK
ncbi:MAG: LicD family protein [Lachnospiraceae bacterium]|nr:LicD family protein [Lachnospiraceae bacterium]